MADLEKTVAIIFQGKDELSKSMQSMDTSLRGFGKGISDFAAPFANIGTSILKVEAAIAGLMGGAMALAISKAGEFGGSFKEISTLVDASSDDIGKFREDVLAYAQSSGKSIADINQSIYKAVSAGVDYKDVLASLSTAEKLSIAGRNDLASTTVLLAGTMNAYGAKTSEAEHYSDVFMETVRRGLTTLPELAGSLANVTGIASMGKVPIETLSAAIAALTATGIPTEQAITGLKNVIANIIKPTDEAQKMAAALGIQFNAAALQTKGLEGVLWDAWRATNGNAESMNTLFGSIRGLNAATILASDSSGRFKETLIAMQDAAGTTEAAYTKMAGGFTLTTQNLKNNIDVLLIDVGQRFLPAYGQIGSGLSDVFKGVKISIDDGTFAPVFDYFTKFGTKLAEDLKIIAKNLPEAFKGVDFSSLLASFDSLGAAVKRAFELIFGSVDLTTVEGLQTFIQKLIDGFTALTQISKGIVEGLDPFFRLIGSSIDSFTTLDATTTDMIGHFMGLAIGIQRLADVFEILLAVLTVRGVVTAITSFGSAILTAGPAILTMVSSLSALQLGFVGLAAVIGAGIGTWLNQITVVQDLAQWIIKLFDVRGNFFGAYDKTKTQIDEENRAFNTAVETMKKLQDAHKDTAVSVSALGPAAEESGKRTVRSFDEILAEVKKTQTSIESLPVQKDIKVGVQADGTSIEKAYGMVLEKFPDGSARITQVKASVDGGSVDSANKKLDELPKEKKVDVTVETTRIKEQSAIIQKSIEWTAKVNMAEAEEATKRLKDMLTSVNTGITSTGTLLGQLFDSLTSGSSQFSYEIKRQIEQENSRRGEEFDLQKKLIDQQIKMNELKIERMKSGNYTVEVKGSGLQPHLEMILWEILTAIQLRANEESSEFLLGIG